MIQLLPISRRTLLSCLASLLLFVSSCSPEPDVVIYCALDQVDSEPILREFERQTGLVVQAEFDVEAHKTVGLVRRIREEKSRPRCDVFWNNEIAHTVSLAADGFLAPYDAPNAADIPEKFRDPERRWTGLAARARVFIVNTDLVDPSEIHGMWDLVDEKWRGKAGMARPLTGTTLTHMTALYVLLGEARAREYLNAIREREVNLTNGNATLMRLVSAGEIAWGWTDTDDYNRAKQKGYPVDIVFPDAEEGGVGTLLIPNSVAVLKDAPHAEAARKLVDYILSVEVERKLASFDGAQIPLHAALKGEPHQLPLERMRVMDVNFAEVGAVIDKHFEEFKEKFID